MDLTAQIVAAINGWLAAAAAQVLQPVFAAVGRLLLTTPAFDTVPEIASTWSVVRGITDALFSLALVAVGVAVMTRGGSDGRYAAKALVPRLVLAAVLANASLSLCGGLIGLNNVVVDALGGGDPAADAFGHLAALVDAPGSTPLLGALVGLAAAAMAVLLAVLYLARDLGLVLAIVCAPLALAAAALPETAELAWLWARLFCALLFVQILQAVLVAIGMQLLAHLDWLGGDGSALGSGFLLLTLLYVLLQLPLAACRWSLQQRAPLGRSTRVLVGAARRALAA